MNTKKGFFILLLGLFISTMALSSDFMVRNDNTVAIYRVQIASRSTDTEAMVIQQQVINSGIPNVTLQSPTTNHGWRVLAGPWPTKSEASTTLTLIKNLGYSDALIVTTDIPLETAKEWNLPLSDNPYRQALFNSSFLPSIPVDSAYNQGISLWNQSNNTDTSKFQAALSSLAQVISQYPSSPQAMESHWDMGQIYASLYVQLRRNNTGDEPTRRKQLEAAVDVLNEYVTTFPTADNAPQAQKQIGDCLHVLSKYFTPRLQKTASAYQKVIINYPDSSITPDAHLQYAGVLFEMAINGAYSWDSVRDELTKVQTLYPNAPRNIKSRAMAMQAESYYFNNNFSQMLFGAQTAINAYSDVTVDAALSQYLVGRAYLEMGDYTNAQTAFDTLLAKYSESSTSEPTVWTLAGFSQLSALDPMVNLCRGGALYGKALCYLQSSDTTNFQLYINQLLDSFPNSQEANLARSQWGATSNSKSVKPSIVKAPIPFLNNYLAQVKEK